MRFAFPIAGLLFGALTTAALAGAPPAKDCCPQACKPIKVMVVEAPSCAAEAPSCAGEDRCHGRSRPSLAERRSERIAGRCAARDARSDARAAARAGCCGTQVVQVVECCEPACSEGCDCK